MMNKISISAVAGVIWILVFSATLACGAGGGVGGGEGGQSGCISSIPCASDLDCPSGHQCNRNLVPPTCQVLYCGEVGESCDRGSMCEWGLLCNLTCEDSADRFIHYDDDTLKDSETGLVWTPTLEESGYNGAIKACEESQFAGFEDWRLPSIDELRTLIVNCKETMTGGACKATSLCVGADCEDGCVAFNCKYGAMIEDDIEEVFDIYLKGDGSEYNMHPGAVAYSSDNEYEYWSSTLAPVELSGCSSGECAYRVEFDSGSIQAVLGVNSSGVRCVR